jgi:hypothetical protein
MKPELSTAHLGIQDRDLEYEEKCNCSPILFTWPCQARCRGDSKTQVPTRWIDQGAIEAVSIVEVPNRYLAGITEVALKNYYADKTNWRKC